MNILNSINFVTSVTRVIFFFFFDATNLGHLTKLCLPSQPIATLGYLQVDTTDDEFKQTRILPLLFLLAYLVIQIRASLSVLSASTGRILGALLLNLVRN